VQDAIVPDQGNRFTENRYIGQWRFVAREAVGPTLSFEEWQAAPYSQDAGSTSVLVDER
jgi:hypothetical protein